MSAVCSRDTVSYRREYGKPLPSEKECLRVLELASKLSSWDGYRAQGEALVSLSLIYDSIPDSEKRNWRDAHWNQALDIVELRYTSKDYTGRNPVSWAIEFHPDLREIAVLREKNAAVGYMLYLGTDSLKVGVNSITTYGTCTATIRYLETQVLRVIKESGEDYWKVKWWEDKKNMQKSIVKKSFWLVHRKDEFYTPIIAAPNAYIPGEVQLKLRRRY